MVLEEGRMGTSSTHLFRSSTSSELEVQETRENCANAFADILVVLLIFETQAIINACEEVHAVGDSEACSLGSELTVLLDIAEIGQIGQDSVDVREVAQAKESLQGY
jgi:hypothetical protein